VADSYAFVRWTAKLLAVRDVKGFAVLDVKGEASVDRSTRARVVIQRPMIIIAATAQLTGSCRARSAEALGSAMIHGGTSQAPA
jgi:hypothetical protein